MRLTRRAVLAGATTTALIGAGGYALAQRPAAVDEPTAIDVRATPFDSFSVTDRERRRFGALTFRSGLILSASHPGFGGFSGLSRSTDGRRLVAMSDNAQWLTAEIATRGGRLAGLSRAVLAPLLFADGRLLRRARFYDTEGLTIADGTAYVSVERRHAVLRFDFARDGVGARGRLIPVPREVQALPSNSGLEAIGVAPPRSPLAGALVAIAERAGDGETTPTRGVILTGPKAGSFDVARRNDFDVTDLAFLRNGEVLLLERRFSILGGLAARLRRLAPDAIRPGALADGPVIFESDPSTQIDNMEGLCVHREGDETIVTMISDDNFSSIQRTLLLEFVLAE